jgi:hypothetical protein
MTVAAFNVNRPAIEAITDSNFKFRKSQPLAGLIDDEFAMAPPQ